MEVLVHDGFTKREDIMLKINTHASFIVRELQLEDAHYNSASENELAEVPSEFSDDNSTISDMEMDPSPSFRTISYDGNILDPHIHWFQNQHVKK